MTEKQKKKNKNVPKIILSPPENISAEEMQHIIARAIVEAEEIKEQQDKKRKEAELKEWQNTIGYKKYNNDCKLFQGIRTLINMLVCLAKISFISKKKIQGNRTSRILIQTALYAFFAVANWILLFMSIVSLVLGAFALFSSQLSSSTWVMGVYFVLFSVPFFLISRMFRIASFEIEKTTDNNYLFTMFAAVTAIVSIIISIIALVK